LCLINIFMGKYYQGFFKPNHPEKYLGNSSNIIYRSSWELKFLMFLDSCPQVISYASEELSIPYTDPLTKKTRRYFPDFLVKTCKDEVLIIEIKPASQTRMPALIKEDATKKVKRVYAESLKVFLLNQAKFEAAERYCRNKGWTFKVLTEKELFDNTAL
jgi:hypothetical protein